MSSSASEICEIARPFAIDIWLSVGQVVQITLCMATLILAPFSLSKRKWRKLPVHINLKILFINVLILYVIVCFAIVVVLIRYQILYRTFSDPCDLLTPSWVSVVVRDPMNTYIVGFPLWHLAITLERSWATYRADAYEKSSSRYGVLAAATVWTVSVGYISYVVCVAMLDPSFQHRTVYVSMTTNTTASLFIVTHWVLLAADLCTSAVDGALIWFNRQNLNSVAPSSSYNLSRSYQLNENVFVTTGLVLPLDVCNTIIFAVFLVLSTWVRYWRDDLPPHRFFGIYECVFSILLLQPLVSLVLYIRFARSQKQVAIVPESNHAGVYFDHFRKQVG